VDAFLDDNDHLKARIHVLDETYVIEPLQPHGLEKEADMIVYRESDVISNLTRPNLHGRQQTFCGNTFHHINNINENASPKDTEKTPIRYRRDASNPVKPAKNTCNLTLVGDYEFFSSVGQKDETRSINYMISVIQRVNYNFKSTVWAGEGVKNVYTGVGLQVAKVQVHKEYQPPGTNKRTYNKKHDSTWDVDALLEAFSRTPWETCLAHLFTYQDFSNGVIGLAYVAGAASYSVGGICTQAYKDLIGERWLNCGLSSSMNWRRRLITSEADLVTMHEIGHNFGSNHDPENANCAPTSRDGKYVMYSTSVDGRKKNNDKFSPCSKQDIGKVLDKKINKCFIEEKTKYCGNFEVEEGEECDPGFNTQGDECCTSKCVFKTGAQCSDRNSQCCHKCKFASKTSKCREKFSYICKDRTFCNGTSDKCPAAPPAPDDTACSRGGRCISGDCRSICNVSNQEDCTCKGANLCKICCRPPGGQCKPHIPKGNAKPLLEDQGTLCIIDGAPGQCGTDGICTKIEKDVFKTFSSLLNDFSLSKLTRFMQANIVGCILILSLILWVPASCIVHYHDNRYLKNYAQLAGSS